MSKFSTLAFTQWIEAATDENAQDSFVSIIELEYQFFENQLAQMPQANKALILAFICHNLSSKETAAQLECSCKQHDKIKQTILKEFCSSTFSTAQMNKILYHRKHYSEETIPKRIYDLKAINSWRQFGFVTDTREANPLPKSYHTQKASQERIEAVQKDIQANPSYLSNVAMRSLYIGQLKERWNVSASMAALLIKRADKKLWRERMRLNVKFSES